VFTGENQGKGQQGWYHGGSVIDYASNIETDKIFYKQLGKVSQSLALIFMGDFNLLDMCWKYNTAERKQSRRFLECVEDNSLTQLVSEPAREGVPLNLLFLNTEGLVGDVMVGGHLGHSDHKITEFPVLGEVRTEVSGTATLDFGGQTLACSGRWLRESLGRQS